MVKRKTVSRKTTGKGGARKVRVRRVTLTLVTWANRCARCGYEWRSEAEEPPRQCARCKVRGWERPARTAGRRK